MVIKESSSITIYRCSVEIIKDDNSKNPLTAYNLSQLRIIAINASNIKAAIRKLNEMCTQFFIVYTTNVTVPGRIPALNIAALHGNIEVNDKKKES